MTLRIPAQRTLPEPAAAVAATAPEGAAAAAGEAASAPAPGWGRVLRTAVARGALALVVSLVAWSVLPLLAGWTPRVILSGSMEPRIHTGDVIVTRTIPGVAVAKGQVVTVKDPDHPGRTRTHRVLRREPDGTIVTQGDANPQADSSHVRSTDVLGLGVVRVPYVGRPAYWLAEHDWAALGGAALALGWCVVTVMPSSRRRADGSHGPDSHGPDSPDQDGSGGSHDRHHSGHSRSRRVAVAAAVVATLVGIGTGPADAAFRTAAGNPVSTIRASTSFHPYATEVLGDSPYLYWRLDETGGTTVADSGPGGRTGTLLAQTYALAQTGALTSESPNRALGLTIGSVTAAAGAAGPSTFSVEAWIRTTSTTGGRILGFGNAGGSTTSTTVDRQLYLGANGYVYFGVGSAKTTVGSTAAVNNGAWHHVVGTYAAGTNGMKLYVDGTLQGQATASVQGFTGFWRAGAEHLTGWTSNPDDYFEGTLDELAVYSTVLTPTQITSHGANAVN